MLEPQFNQEPLIQLLDRPLIYDELFDEISPASLIRLGRTCRTARHAVQDYSQRAFDINRHLSRFFTNPIAFRSLLAQTGAVVSGSNALQFLDRSFYPESDLDIYVYKETAREIEQWLKNDAGKSYVLVRTTVHPHTGVPWHVDELEAAEDDPFFEEPDIVDLEPNLDIFHKTQYRINGVSDVHTFVSEDNSDTYPLQVQIILTKESPLHCILNFHSTAVMNVITHWAAYSLYPKATFEERRTLVCVSSDAYQNMALAKYAARGFRSIADIFPNEAMSIRPSFPLGTRWVNDKHAWVLPLDMTGVKIPPFSASTPPLSFDPFSLNAWTLTEGVGTEPPTMGCWIIKTSLLRFRYTAYREFFDIFKPFLMRQGPMEYKKRRTFYKNTQLWTWWDHVLPSYKTYHESISLGASFADSGQ